MSTLSQLESTISNGQSKEQVSMARFSPWTKNLPMSEIQGRRNVVITYRTATSGPNKGRKVAEDCYASVPDDYLSIPVLMQQADRLMPYLRKHLISVEKELLSELHQRAVKGLSDSSFTLDWILGHLDAKGEGTRLTKDEIKVWWRSDSVRSIFGLVAASRMDCDLFDLDEEGNPSDDFTEQVENWLHVIGSKLESFSDVRASFVVEDQEVLTSILSDAVDVDQESANADEDNESNTPIVSTTHIFQTIVSKLDAMKAKTKSDLAGF